MGVTKKAKDIQVTLVPQTYYMCEYQCPTCKTHFKTPHIDSMVTQIKCTNCSQELRITDRIKK